MRTNAIILGGALGVSLLALACPESMRSAVVERAQIPDHVYEEAGRQLDVFVAWARNEAAVPDYNTPAADQTGRPAR